MTEPTDAEIVAAFARSTQLRRNVLVAPVPPAADADPGPVAAADPDPAPAPSAPVSPWKAEADRFEAEAAAPRRRAAPMSDLDVPLIDVKVDPGGRLAMLSAYLQGEFPPTIKAPAGPVTPFGVLMANGWTPPDPELAEVASRIETLHAGWAALKATRSLHRGSEEDIGEAIRKADPVAFVSAVVAVAVDAWIAGNAGQDYTYIARQVRSLREREIELVHRHQDAILASLAGLDSPAAAEARRVVSDMRGRAVPPPLGMFEAILR